MQREHHSAKMQFAVSSTTVVAVRQDQQMNKIGDSMCIDSAKRLRSDCGLSNCLDMESCSTCLYRVSVTSPNYSSAMYQWSSSQLDVTNVWCTGYWHVHHVMFCQAHTSVPSTHSRSFNLLKNNVTNVKMTHIPPRFPLNLTFDVCKGVNEKLLANACRPRT